MHREHFDPAEVEFATLLSIKTGGCPEDCGYCPQSVHYDTGVEADQADGSRCTVREAAPKAKAAGATRFCMGAAWRAPKDRDIENVVHADQDGEGRWVWKTCCTLGMLTKEHAERAARKPVWTTTTTTWTPRPRTTATSSARATTRTAWTRWRTCATSACSVCSGGIIGMGENRRQRAELIGQLANLHPHYPDSVPINNLVKVEGTPLAEADDIDPLEFVRMIAVARITMPKARVRLSAGRSAMADTMQALCFMAGANSIFYGEKLLTTGNPDVEADTEPDRTPRHAAGKVRPLIRGSTHAGAARASRRGGGYDVDRTRAGQLRCWPCWCALVDRPVGRATLAALAPGGLDRALPAACRATGWQAHVRRAEGDDWRVFWRGAAGLVGRGAGVVAAAGGGGAAAASAVALELDRLVAGRCAEAATGLAHADR